MSTLLTKNEAITHEELAGALDYAAISVRRWYYSARPCLPPAVDLDDLLQVARISVLLCVRRFQRRGAAEFRTYAGACGLGNVKAYVRDLSLKRIRWGVSLVPLSGEDGEAAARVKDGDPSPHDQAEARALWRSVAALPDPLPAILYDVADGFTHREIAIALGMPRSHVTKLYGAAIAALCGNASPRTVTQRVAAWFDGRSVDLRRKVKAALVQEAGSDLGVTARTVKTALTVIRRSRGIPDCRPSLSRTRQGR